MNTDDEFIAKELENLEKELKKFPPLSPEEQKIIDMLGQFMAEQALEDEARGIRHKLVKRKK